MPRKQAASLLADVPAITSALTDCGDHNLRQPFGVSLALHDDSAIATQAVLEDQLEFIRTVAVGPVAGVFGPESVMWRLNREAIVFLAAGRALLLQLAHPWVAAAVANHSRGLTEPIVRFHRTFSVVFSLVFGTTDQAFAAARRLHRRHSSVTGVLPGTAGPFKESSKYCANNISALRWVHATLIESALVAHDLVLGPLTADERQRYYVESKLFAELFGIPRSFLPADWETFTAYTEAMSHSDILTISPAARAIAAQIFAGAGTWFRIPGSYHAVTLAILPERVRRDFGFSYDETERQASARAIKWVRRAYPLLPRRIRHVGPYQEAVGRLRGRLLPDAATQLLNRFWMGQRSLGG